MSIERRLRKLEQNTHPAGDTLTEQVIDIWHTIGADITHEQAEQIADTYRKRGLTVLAWEDVFVRDIDEH